MTTVTSGFLQPKFSSLFARLLESLPDIGCVFFLFRTRLIDSVREQIRSVYLDVVRSNVSGTTDGNNKCVNAKFTDLTIYGICKANHLKFRVLTDT